MRELSCWALSSGKPESCVPKAKQFAEFLGALEAANAEEKPEPEESEE